MVHALAAGGLEDPAKEVLYREYIGLAEALRESVRLAEQDLNVAEEVQESDLPIPASPRQPIPTQWFLRRVTELPELVEIVRSASEEELWCRVGGPEAKLILAAVQNNLITGVVERAQTEELGGDPHNFNLSQAPIISPFADEIARTAAPPYLPPPPEYLPAPPTYEDNCLRPNFLGLAEGLEQIEREESPLEYMTATGEILEDPHSNQLGE
ncbi:uncharacterized protein FIBRA_09617 [Fibroporia radiculosa]|uniref:Uncharacterized protein n=1 Tax=Fibroporia radiculosa TaxID=599839 RepID=J7S6Q9_9APHY|nr:uncharacterized protein FIBRA_09617 [Fibroporia radiculosa]CCM07269.1 predicted protein [Fibroporia radiculosa]